MRLRRLVLGCLVLLLFVAFTDRRVVDKQATRKATAQASTIYYEVQLARDSLFTNKVLDVVTVDTFYAVTALAPQTMYWWRVRASYVSVPDSMDSTNTSAWPAAWNFTTGDEPAVPITLVYFVGTRTPEGFARLQWKTESETNNYGFELQRDGKLLIFIPGHGTTLQPQLYEYIDRKRRAASYTLVQVDMDGTRTNKGTLALGGRAQEGAYPNPFNSQTTINLPYNTKSIQIYTLNGQLVFEKAIREEDSVVWGAGVATGVYFVRIQGDKTLTLKLLKLK